MANAAGGAGNLTSSRTSIGRKSYYCSRAYCSDRTPRPFSASPPPPNEIPFGNAVILVPRHGHDAIMARTLAWHAAIFCPPCVAGKVMLLLSRTECMFRRSLGLPCPPLSAPCRCRRRSSRSFRPVLLLWCAPHDDFVRVPLHRHAVFLERHWCKLVKDIRNGATDPHLPITDAKRMRVEVRKKLS